MLSEQPIGDQRALVETAAALSAEARRLRASARIRAVIEQAKGVLVERYRLTLDEALTQLRAMAQENGVPLVEVAAAVLGVPVPAGADVAAGDQGRIQQLPLPQGPQAPEQTPPSAGATAPGDEAAQLLLDMVRGQDVAILTIYRREMGDSLRLVGQVGLPTELVGSWWHVPPGTDVPYTRAVVTGRAQYFRSRAAWVAEFPALAAARSVGEAVVTVPLADDEGRVTHVVGLIWNGVQEFDAERRELLTTTVQRTASPLMRLVAVDDPQLNWLNALLRLHLDPWLLLEPTKADDGMPEDFVVMDTAMSLRREGWRGRRARDLWPELPSSHHFASLRTLMQSGGVWSSVVAEPMQVPWGVTGATIRAVRLGEHLAIVWRTPAARSSD